MLSLRAELDVYNGVSQGKGQFHVDLVYGYSEHDDRTRFAISDHKQRSTEHVMAFPITHKNQSIDIVQRRVFPRFIL